MVQYVDMSRGKRYLNGPICRYVTRKAVSKWSNRSICHEESGIEMVQYVDMSRGKRYLNGPICRYATMKAVSKWSNRSICHEESGIEMVQYVDMPRGKRYRNGPFTVSFHVYLNYYNKHLPLAVYLNDFLVLVT